MSERKDVKLRTEAAIVRDMWIGETKLFANLQEFARAEKQRLLVKAPPPAPVRNQNGSDDLLRRLVVQERTKRR